MKKVLLLSALFSTLFGINNLQAQDDDDDRPVVRKDRAQSTSDIKSVYAINLMHVTENNVGFAVSYEHFFDKSGIISLYLPLSFSLPQRDNYYIDNNYYGGYYNYYSLTDVYEYSGGMATFYPGIKIYPGGGHKKVSYALGSSLVFGFGTLNRSTINYRIDTVYTGGPQNYIRAFNGRKDESLSQFKLGMLITNHLNIRPGRYYFGLEFGVGYTYLNNIGGSDADRTALVQFGIKTGLTR